MTYPYPPDRPAPADISEDVARYYEETVLQLLREEPSSWHLGVPREILSLHLGGRRPATQLIIRYRDIPDGDEHSARWPIWDDLEADGLNEYESPHNVVSLFIAHWNAGEINPKD